MWEANETETTVHRKRAAIDATVLLNLNNKALTWCWKEFVRQNQANTGKNVFNFIRNQAQNGKKNYATLLIKLNEKKENIKTEMAWVCTTEWATTLNTNQAALSGVGATVHERRKQYKTNLKWTDVL